MEDYFWPILGVQRATEVQNNSNGLTTSPQRNGPLQLSSTVPAARQRRPETGGAVQSQDWPGSATAAADGDRVS